jgi:hypothetical protein
MTKFVKEKEINNKTIGGKEFFMIHERFCEDDFLTDANELYSTFRHTPDTKIESIRNLKAFITMEEIFKYFDSPSNVFQGGFQGYKILIIYYMVHFLNSNYKSLIDEVIKNIGNKDLVLKKKIKYMGYLIHQFRDDGAIRFKAVLEGDGNSRTEADSETNFHSINKGSKCDDQTNFNDGHVPYMKMGSQEDGPSGIEARIEEDGIDIGKWYEKVGSVLKSFKDTTREIPPYS